MSDKVALVRLRAKNDQYDAAMKDSAKHTRGLANAGDDVAKSSTGMAAGLRLAAAAGAAVIAKQSIDAASNLAEAQSKVGVVFGESAEKVNQFAANSASAFGQSTAQALEATGTFGNLFRSIGLTEQQSAQFSTTLTGLASDLASFNNTSVDDALTALRSGLVGETEPLKRFGVNLNEAALKAEALKLGLSDGKGVLDANAKAQAAYSLIMEQTTLAQGDFARTADGVANKQRIASAQFEDAKAKLGQGLLPAMSALLGVGSDVIGVFNAMPGPLQMTALAAAALAIAGPKVAAAWDAVAVSMRNAGGALTSTVSSVGLLKSAGLSLVAGVAAYNLTYQALEKMTGAGPDVEKLADALKYLGESGKGLPDVFEVLGGSGGAEAVAGDFRTLSDGLGNVDKALGFLEGTMGRFGAIGPLIPDGSATKLDDARKSVHAYDEALANLARSSPAEAERAFQLLTNALTAQGLSVEEINQLLPQFNSVMGTASTQEQLATEKKQEHTDAIEEQTDAYQANVDAARQRYDLAMAAVDADQAVNDAVIGVAEANDRVAEAEQGVADAQEAVADANDAVADARERVGEAHEKVAEAQRGVVDAMAAEQDAAEAVADAVSDVADAEAELSDARRRATGDSDEMRDALEGVEDAQEALTESQKRSTDAVAELDRVTKDYSQTLSDLQDDAAGAADDVIMAGIAVRKAKEDLANLGKNKDGTTDPVTADERLAAEVRVREAERRERDAKERAAKAAEDLKRNEANGVEGSDAYIEASKNVKDAKDDEATAHENLEDAVTNVAKVQEQADADVAAAEQNLAEKIKAVSKAQQARIDAHQDVVDAQANVQKAAEGVRNAEQEVADRLADVRDRQADVVKAKDAVVTARGEVATAEGKVAKALVDQAEAHADLARNTDKGVKPQKDMAAAMQAVLDKMDPNDPRFKGLQLYVEMMKTLAGLGALNDLGGAAGDAFNTWPGQKSGGKEQKSGLGMPGSDPSDIVGKKVPPIINVQDPGAPIPGTPIPWTGNPAPWVPEAPPVYNPITDQAYWTSRGQPVGAQIDYDRLAHAIAAVMPPVIDVGGINADGLTAGQAVTLVDTTIANAVHAIGYRG